MKGHTKIELKDVKTGEVKVYEDDNMFTSAISQMVNFAVKHGLGTNPLDIYSTHWANLLGGIVLFNTALTESVDNVYLPAGVTPMGYGIQGDTNSYTSIPEWGIYNTNESDTSATDTKKMVWDFATDHANGTIASIALTHKNNGLFGFGMATYANTARDNYADIAVGTIITQSRKGKQDLNSSNYGRVGSNLSLNDGSYVDFCIDSTNDVKYMFKVCADGISIIKHNLYPEKFDVFRSSTYYQEYTEETYAGTFSGSYFYHSYNPDEKILYFWTTTSEIDIYNNTNATITIHRFDMTTKTLTASWHIATLSLSGSQTSWSIYNSFVITNEGIYFFGYRNNYQFRKYVFASGSSVDVIQFTSGNYENNGLYGGKPYLINGLIYIHGFVRYDTYKAYAVIIDTSDDSVRYTNLLGSVYYYGYSSRYQKVPPIDNTQVIWGSRLDAGTIFSGNFINLQGSGSSNANIGNMSAPVHYLGTINNLSTPVVKNATQTMKITYTITAESEE